MEPHSTRSGGQGPGSGVNPHLVQLQHEIELRRNAELRANNYQTENRRLRDALKSANVLNSAKEGAVAFFESRTSFYSAWFIPNTECRISFLLKWQNGECFACECFQKKQNFLLIFEPRGRPSENKTKRCCRNTTLTARRRSAK